MKTGIKKSSGAVSKPAHQAFFAKAGSSGFFAAANEPKASAVQLKMTANKPGDKLEQEADNMADKVMKMSAPEEKVQNQEEEPLQKAEEPERTIQKQEDEKLQKTEAAEDKLQKAEKEHSPIQTKFQGVNKAQFVPATWGRPPDAGEPLNSHVRARVETVLGSDLEGVRIHGSMAARAMAADLNAKAYTHGEHIWLGPGQRGDDLSLMAHELTHVIQQRNPSMVPSVQRTLGDGHDLESPRFSGNLRLEAAFDDESHVQAGSQGVHVVILQEALTDAGHPLPVFGVDGIFGSETHGAVKSYQDDRLLRVDGIVGPETMGDLDRFFGKNSPQPKIPPEPIDICSILSPGKQNSGNDNNLVFVKSLTPEQQESAEEKPTADLPGGGIAIDCNAPTPQKKCKELCGCPLPSTGYTAKIGDLAQVMKNATAFHEEDPQPNQDRRQIVCPPKNAAVQVLQVINSPNGLTFLKVRFCNGPVPDKNGKMVSEVFIQQRFVDNGKQIAIKGPNEIQKPNSIKLEAEGSHAGTNPVWEIQHDAKSHGRAKIAGSNGKSTVEIEGEELSSLEQDVTVKVTVCGNVAFHKLTIREKFVPNLPVPSIPTTPPGPIKPAESPPFYCEPISDKAQAMKTWLAAKIALQSFISAAHSNNKDTLDLYMTYMETPKVGTKGTLPPRRLFSSASTDFVKSFARDPETNNEKTRIRDLIVARVQADPKLIPPVGKTTLLLPFRTVLKESEIMNLPMSFESPTTRIPGFVAGGFGKNSSDAGDDVRNVDGQFRVTNQGGGTLRIQINYIFDVHDAVDFCPGAHGGPKAWPLTIPLSQLEATPDVPTYDTPFEVLYKVTDDLIV